MPAGERQLIRDAGKGTRRSGTVHNLQQRKVDTEVEQKEQKLEEAIQYLLTASPA